MILDADLTVPPEELPRFYEALVAQKGEFINGSRLGLSDGEAGDAILLICWGTNFSPSCFPSFLGSVSRTHFAARKS